MTLSGALVGIGILQAIIYLLFIRAIDLYEREPLRYVVPVFIWGFAVATTISLVFNSIASVTFDAVVSKEVASFLTAVFVAPVVEECTKGSALLIIFVVAYLASRRRRLIEFAGVMDGIVYGAAVGFGFALAEDILYGMQYGAETFLVRRIFGGFAHAAFTSLTGIGLGLIPFVHNRVLKAVPPLLGLLGAILLHATFNFLATVFGVVAYLFMFLMVLAYLIVILVWLTIERRAIRGELSEEVAEGLISPEEYAILPTFFRRTAYYLRLIFTGHLSAWSRARRVHSAAVDLAFAKSLARRLPAPSRIERVQALRQKIVDLRTQADPRVST